jgi:hypothetical protein
MIAVFLPSAANRAAIDGPACPVPIIIASNSSMSFGVSFLLRDTRVSFQTIDLLQYVAFSKSLILIEITGASGNKILTFWLLL